MKVDAISNNCKEALVGCILGAAVGDAVGLVCEGLPWRRQARMYPNISGPQLIGRRGMVSDDTEHTCMLAQALIDAGGDPSRFTRSLSRRMRIWLLGIPAGIGLATLRSIIKMWFGVSPENSGVYSAGNGPAMRSALLGVCFGADPVRLRALVRASSRMTHTDSRAESGALAVAIAAYVASLPEDQAPLSRRFIRMFEAVLGQSEDEDVFSLILDAVASVERGETTHAFASSIGCSDGVSGFICHTVPAAIHCWLRNPSDFRTAVLEIIHCGGDTDSTAAIVGAIIGARVGKAGIPEEWRNSLLEWPCTVAWMERLAVQLAQVCADGKPRKALSLAFPAVLARNAFFAIVVLAHGFRRVLPPYGKII